MFQVLWTICLPRSPPPSRRSSVWWHLWTRRVWWTGTWSTLLMSTAPSPGWVCLCCCEFTHLPLKPLCASKGCFVFSRRRTGRPGVRVLRPDGSGALQTHPQHRGEAEREVWRQAVVLPQQGRWSWEWNRQTGQSCGFFFFIPKLNLKKKSSYLCVSAEGDDADSPGTVSPSRSQQMWFWDADNLHPQPPEG